MFTEVQCSTSTCPWKYIYYIQFIQITPNLACHTLKLPKILYVVHAMGRDTFELSQHPLADVFHLLTFEISYILTPSIHSLPPSLSIWNAAVPSLTLNTTLLSLFFLNLHNSTQTQGPPHFLHHT